MTKIKKTLLLLVFSIFIFSLGYQANAGMLSILTPEKIKALREADATNKDKLAKELNISPYFTWIDLSKFRYFDPDSDDFFGSSATFTDQLKWSENDDPHYQVKMKLPEINNLDDINDFLDSKVVNNVMKTVTDSIYGMTLLRVKTLKDLKAVSFSETEQKNLEAKLKAHNCESVSKVRSDISGWLNKIDSASADNDDTISLNTNYTYYNCYDIYDLAYMAKINQSPKAGDVLFLAGMTSSSKMTNGFLEKTINGYQSHFKSIIKEGVDTKFNTTKVKDLAQKTISQFATGACYEVMPKGTQNKCATTIAGNCKTAKNIFFINGITCERLNPLFADQDSSAANILGTESAAEKARIKMEFQVPFGDVKNGITLPEYINAIYKYLLSFGLVLSGILLAIGGFQYVAGKPGPGKTMIINSITGMVLLSSVYLILQTINPATLDLPEIAISEIDRDAVSEATMLADTQVKVPAAWVPLTYTDPFKFTIPAPTDLSKLKKESLWNTHYYTLFKASSPTKQGIYRYPIADESNKILFWTNTSSWCAAAMEGSAIFMLNSKLVPINVTAGGAGSIKKIPKSAWHTNLDQTLKDAGVKTMPPVYQINKETPKCSWWSSNTNSLWARFHQKPSKYTFGDAGGQGALIPLRSIAIRRNSTFTSILKKYIPMYGVGTKNLLIYIPDAKGVELKAPDGSMIKHDGYFWVSDSGSLTQKKSAETQIDMFTGTLEQKILDGKKHNAYIIPCKAEPGKSICDKFYKTMKSGFPDIKKK